MTRIGCCITDTAEISLLAKSQDLEPMQADVATPERKDAFLDHLDVWSLKDTNFC